ncbi:MAG: hypothetical protein ACRDJM_07395, partial [Actinomycetota bacterium]
VGLGTAIPSAVLSAPDARALPSGVAATASFRDGTWTAYLRARSSRVIFREAEVRYAGAPGAHRRGEVVPVVALTRAHA